MSRGREKQFYGQPVGEETKRKINTEHKIFDSAVNETEALKNLLGEIMYRYGVKHEMG